MHYLTRHLEALREFPHGSDHMRLGDRFYATPVDADYYIARKMAAAVPQPAPAQPVHTNAEASEPQAVSISYSEADATSSEEEGKTEEVPAEPEVTRPRRGRPPRNLSQD